MLAMTVVATAGFLVGCTTYHDYDAFVTRPQPVVTATEYRMAPPDVILIESKRVKEIDQHRETIRPDGRITLPLLGSVFIAGRTPEEASLELSGMAREYYQDADVSLRVVSFNSKKIYVFGEVLAPGPYAYDGANTILEVLAHSQPSRLADPDHIHILRPSADGKTVKRMTINANKMIKEGDTSLDAVLEEGDIVFVPPNALAAVGLAFQQLLLPIQPAAATVKGPADIGQSATGTTYGRTN
jgi:polysaccharide export outer membrane protein